MRRRTTFAALLCAGAIVALVFLLAAQRAGVDNHAQGQRQLQLLAPDLESALEKFETLPFVVGFQADVAQLLTHPGDAQLVNHLNRTLQTIARHAKVSHLYLLDRDGNTLAASNWQDKLSFVGKNFAYRPYFRDAMHGQPGRFYAIGNSTGEAGYFIAQPVNLAGALMGVVVLKISLAEFETSWSSSDAPIALADQSGVVFLSNRAAWKYHSLQALTPATQQQLVSTQQYAGQPIAPIASLAPPQRDGFGPHVSQPVGRLGWQLMMFPAPGRALRNAALWALATALALACLAVTALALNQRRLRLEERSSARVALQRAAEDLDLQLAARTGELRLTNQDLERKYAKLQETEHLLRSTQNELIQAGKLAMLGQMAAGVTHELNQPLAAIRAFADNARTFLERGQPDQASSNLGHISDASARMGAIIGQLKGFARKSESVATVDVARSIAASAFLLDSEFRRHGVTLTIAPAPGAPVLVAGDAVRIEQVLINLLRNALDAVESSATRMVAVSLARADGAALVCIRDSGAGIPQQVAAHLFEPFFTTKPSGKGLGLGLAISSSIVQAMNGQLTAHNHVDGGAEFVVRLPLHHEGE